MTRNEAALLSAALNHLSDCLVLIDRMVVHVQTIRAKIDRQGNAVGNYLDGVNAEHALEDEFNTKREKETMQ